MTFLRIRERNGKNNDQMEQREVRARKGKMIDQEEFNQTLKKFEELEKRGTFYPMFLKMIEKGFETEALLFILSTWNFAAFRYVVNDFDTNNFKKIIKEQCNPIFDKLKDKTLETVTFEEIKEEIEKLYNLLSAIKGVKYTGASKIMHLKNPKLFVMWDGYIRKACELKKGDSEDYFNFLKKMQNEFKDIKSGEGRTLAKCIDEYNYVKFTLPALEKNRNKKKNSM